MKWMQARLAFETGDARGALDLATKDLPALSQGLEPGLKNEIESTAALLKARASFALNDEAGAKVTLEKPTRRFPEERRGGFSYIVQANYYAEQKEPSKPATFHSAGRRVSKARLSALCAFSSRASGRTAWADLEEANQRIEDLLTKYPKSSLFFPARLKQGDLLRRLNQFPKRNVPTKSC